MSSGGHDAAADRQVVAVHAVVAPQELGCVGHFAHGDQVPGRRPGNRRVRRDVAPRGAVPDDTGMDRPDAVRCDFNAQTSAATPAVNVVGTVAPGSISRATAAARAALRLVITTRAPRAARCSGMTGPMPVLPPTTPDCAMAERSPA